LHFTAEVVLLTIFLGLGFALVLNEVFPGRRIVRVLTLVPWALSEYVTAVIWRDVYSSEYGFVNGVLFSLRIIDRYLNFLTPEWVVELLAVAFAWHIVPIMAFFLLGGLQSIPEEIYSQAKVDGVGPVKRFLTITFPYIRYAFLVALIFVTFLAITATDMFIVLTGGGPGISSESLTFQIYKTSFLIQDISYGAAISFILLIITVPILISYFVILTRKR